MLIIVKEHKPVIGRDLVQRQKKSQETQDLDLSQML